jgi:hypothetical protein
MIQHIFVYLEKEKNLVLIYCLRVEFIAQIGYASNATIHDYIFNFCVCFEIGLKKLWQDLYFFVSMPQ